MSSQQWETLVWNSSESKDGNMYPRVISTRDEQGVSVNRVKKWSKGLAAVALQYVEIKKRVDFPGSEKQK